MAKPYTLQRKKLKNKTVYYIRYAWSDDLGQYTKTKATDATRADAARVIAEKMLRRGELGIDTQKKEKAPTVNALLREAYQDDSTYLSYYADIKRQPMSFSHLRARRLAFKNHIETYKPFNNIIVTAVKPIHVVEFRATLIKKGFQPSTINGIVSGLLHVIKWYCNMHSEPFLLATVERISAKQQKETRRRGALTMPEIRLLIDYEIPEDEDPRYYWAVKIGLLTGARISEIRALRWGDVDTAAGTINIVRQIDEQTKEEKPPKAGSAGQIPIFSPLDEILLSIGEWSRYTLPDDYILAGFDRKAPAHKYMRRTLIKMLEKIGVDEKERIERRLTFHSLRHSAATLLQTAGMTLVQAAAVTRHRKLDILSGYTHPENVLDFHAEKDRLRDTLGASKKAENE